MDSIPQCRAAFICARTLTFLAVCAAGLPQTAIYDRIPRTRAALEGSKTVLSYRLSRNARTVFDADSPLGQVFIRLPSVRRKAVPHLLGMLDRGGDLELFLGWAEPENEEGQVGHHIEIFRGRRGTEAVFVHEFTLFGAAGAQVDFFQSPDARDTPAVLIDIQGGAYWSTTYVLASDRQSADRLFEASDYEFADLDSDGDYELIAWSRRPFDVRCNFGVFAVRSYPEVFIRDDGRYRRAWPPAGWAPPDGQLENHFRNHERKGVPWGAAFQIVAGFADLGGDGVTELIVLEDRLRDEPTQSLAVYRLDHRSFRLVAQLSLPRQRIAYLVSGIRDSPNGKEILVRTAIDTKCKAGGDPGAPGTAEMAYILHGHRLQPAEPHKR